MPKFKGQENELQKKNQENEEKKTSLKKMTQVNCIGQKVYN
jgi:hypothetical protein